MFLLRDNIREVILDIVDHQIDSGDAPFITETYDRLRKLGYPDEDCRKLIAQCLVVEMYHSHKDHNQFDKKRFYNSLNKLPDRPV